MDADHIARLASRETEAVAGGAGGKVRKPPPRKPPATPYNRPPEAGRRRWITKLVDPAFRLIAGGATRILPSIFSTASAPSGPHPDAEDQVKWRAGEHGYCDDAEGQSDGSDKNDLHLGGSKSTELTCTGDSSCKKKSCSDLILHSHREDKNVCQSEENRLSDIELLVKRNNFSRDDFNRLVELLNSREMALANGEQGKDRKEDERLAIAHKLPVVSNDRRREDSKGTIWGSSTPLGQSNVRGEIGASPIEIARAYMDSCATEIDPSSKSMRNYVGSRLLHGDEVAITPYDPSPSIKTPSTCWPGVVVQDAYITPQGQRSKDGLYKFPRTPYSRTLLSKSKSRFNRIEGAYSNISLTPLNQPQTVYMQDNKSIDDAPKGGYGSVGPIRRISRKVGSETSSRLANSSQNGPLQRESSVINEGFTPTVTKGLDPDVRNAHKQVSFMTALPVHMHTSLMAKKILEHIDRNIPTPNEKSAELNLATKWKSTESPANASTILSNENNGLLKLKNTSPYKYDGFDVMKSMPRNERQGDYRMDILPKESTDVRKEGTSASDMNVCSIIPKSKDANAKQKYGGSENFLMKSTGEDELKTLHSGGHPSVVNEEKKAFSNSSSSKPVLTPISINKADSKWALTSDNGSGFTFPISTYSSLSSEPPTPSIMPFLPSGDMNQSKERSTELSYSFGLKKSNATVIFSFPSTSKPALNNNANGIKFSFGSNEKARLCFSF